MLEEFLSKGRLFAEESLEDRFRVALGKYIRVVGDSSEIIREVSVSDRKTAPEVIAEVLASIVAKKPVLLSSDRWGHWTRDAFSRANQGPLAEGAILIRTGGSSGEPKFAIHSWESLLASVLNLWTHLGKQPISSRLDLPLSHVSGLMPVIRAIVSGGQLVLGTCTDLDPLPGLRVASVVPTTLYRNLKDPESLNFLRRMNFVFAGGAAFPTELLSAARKEKLRLSLVYGMTETAGMVASQDPEDFLAGEPPCVSAMPGNEVSVNSDGEILIESEQLFLGYLGQAPRKGFRWSTGDLGSIDEEGALTVLRRKGRFFSTGGETVSLERIEKSARGLPGVSGALAVVRPDQEWGGRVSLFLIAGNSGNRDFRRELKSILDPAEIPAEVHLKEEFPRTGSGKVDMDRLFG